MGSAAQRQRHTPGPREEVGGDLLEDLHGHVAVVRERGASNGRKEQPVRVGEVAHDALQVAARREVEDDVQGPWHGGIMSSAPV